MDRTDPRLPTPGPNPPAATPLPTAATPAEPQPPSSTKSAPASSALNKFQRRLQRESSTPSPNPAPPLTPFSGHSTRHSSSTTTPSPFQMERGAEGGVRPSTSHPSPPLAPPLHSGEEAGGRGASNPQSATRNPQFSEWLTSASPEWPWDAPHLRLLQHELDRVTAGEVDRLMLFLPPRHGKTELVTVRYPVYRLEQDPSLRVLVAAHSSALARRFSRKSRRLARARLPLSPERAAAEEWETLAGGGLRAVGVGTGIAGLGANLILIDDPVRSREEADSPAHRDRVWDWYRDDLTTRAEPRAAVILIMTRWHEDDLAGRLLASDEAAAWRVVRLPALAEEPEPPAPEQFAICNSQFAICNPDPLNRLPGAPLWPERFNQQALQRIERTLGPRGFAALYQGRPIPAKGGLFHRDWFQLVDPTTPTIGNWELKIGNSHSLHWVRFWDTAAKAGQRSDYWAGALLARTPDGDWCLADLVRGRWEYPEAKRRVLETAARDGREIPVGIEDSASGAALLQDLRRDEAAAGYAFWPLRVTAGKEVRAGAWASLAEGGRFHLLRAPWLDAFLEEVTAFPHAPHDDQVDAVTGAFEMLLRRHTPTARPLIRTGRSR